VWDEVLVKRRRIGSRRFKQLLSYLEPPGSVRRVVREKVDEEV
jgi:hypothetical protein